MRHLQRIGADLCGEVVGGVALRVDAGVVERIHHVVADADKAGSVGPHTTAQQLPQQQIVAGGDGFRALADVLPQRISLAQTQSSHKGEHGCDVVVSTGLVDVHTHVTHRIHQAALQRVQQRLLCTLQQRFERMHRQEKQFIPECLLRAGGVPGAAVLSQRLLRVAG